MCAFQLGHQCHRPESVPFHHLPRLANWKTPGKVIHLRLSFVNFKPRRAFVSMSVPLSVQEFLTDIASGMQ